MSGGSQALMRTRCPACGTVFRVTSEQLRRKAGKVRCGHCQSVFNAFDEWQADPLEPAIDTPATDADLSSAVDHPATGEADVAQAAAEADVESLDHAEECLEGSSPDVAEQPEDWVPEDDMSVEVDEPVVLLHDADPDPLAAIDVEAGQEQVPETESVSESESVSAVDEVMAETPEESTLAAREAGLVAARDLSDTSAYNRWAAGTLAGNGLGGFGGEPPRRAVWPFVLVAVVLLIVLLGQLFYYFRTEIVLRLPDTVAIYELAGADIPLPRNPALVSIETSDLQSDNARGLFVLQATLKNGAAYPQAWPALELSLTDTNDSVVSRRVMYAAEYLPPGTASDSFPANGEVAVKLWIETKEAGASGYRLYIFYP